MATIQELTDENAMLKIELVDLQTRNAMLKVKLVDLQTKNVVLLGVEEAVKGIIHQIEVHDGTAEDLRDALVTLKTKIALSEVIK